MTDFRCQDSTLGSFPLMDCAAQATSSIDGTTTAAVTPFNFSSATLSSSSSSSSGFRSPLLRDRQQIEVVASPPARNNRPYSIASHVEKSPNNGIRRTSISLIRRTFSSNDVRMAQSPTTYSCVSCQPASPHCCLTLRQQTSRSVVRRMTPSPTSALSVRCSKGNDSFNGSTPTHQSPSVSPSSMSRLLHSYQHRDTTPLYKDKQNMCKQMSSDFQLPPAIENDGGAEEGHQLSPEWSFPGASQRPQGPPLTFENGDDLNQNHEGCCYCSEDNSSSSRRSRFLSPLPASSHLPPFPSTIEDCKSVRHPARALATTSSSSNNSSPPHQAALGEAKENCPPVTMIETELCCDASSLTNHCSQKLPAQKAINTSVWSDEGFSNGEMTEPARWKESSLWTSSESSTEKRRPDSFIDWLSYLPFDLLRHSIFEFLDVRDIYRITGTCQYLYTHLYQQPVPPNVVNESEIRRNIDQAKMSRSEIDYRWDLWSTSYVTNNSREEHDSNRQCKRAAKSDIQKDDEESCTAAVETGETIVVLSPRQFLNRHVSFFDPPLLAQPISCNVDRMNSTGSELDGDESLQPGWYDQAEHLSGHHLTLGRWWNTLTPSSDSKLTQLLSRVKLKTIKVEPEFYDCLCSSCAHINARSLSEKNAAGCPTETPQDIALSTVNQSDSASSERRLQDDDNLGGFRSLMTSLPSENDSQLWLGHFQDATPTGLDVDQRYEHPHRPSDPPMIPSPLFLGGSSSIMDDSQISPLSLMSPLPVSPETFCMETRSAIEELPRMPSNSLGPTTSSAALMDSSVLNSTPSRTSLSQDSQFLGTSGAISQQEQARSTESNATSDEINHYNGSHLDTSYRLLPLYVDETSLASTSHGYLQFNNTSPRHHIPHLRTVPRNGSIPTHELAHHSNRNGTRFDNTQCGHSELLSFPQDDEWSEVFRGHPNNDGSNVLCHFRELTRTGYGDNRVSINEQEERDLVVAKHHVAARFFWIFRLMLLSRYSLERIDFGTPNVKYQTIGDDSKILPDFPLNLRYLDQRFIFPQLKYLRFGYTIDCRFIVPIIDFCKYPSLREIHVLGLACIHQSPEQSTSLSLHYDLGTPQFGIKPTMAFGPQQIFSEDQQHPLWLPALYNGGTDEALQLQDRGVYASREYHYEGSFKNGRNDGFGRMTSKCGETYEGQWKNGRRHGQGVVVQSDGKRLEGEWVKDVLHGRGSMELPNGLKYEGEWVCGALEGWGILSKDGYLLAVGQWIEGKPHGWMLCRKEYFTSDVYYTDLKEGEERQKKKKEKTSYIDPCDPHVKMQQMDGEKQSEGNDGWGLRRHANGFNEERQNLGAYVGRVVHGILKSIDRSKCCNYDEEENPTEITVKTEMGNEGIDEDDDNDDRFIPSEDVLCELDTIAGNQRTQGVEEAGNCKANPISRPNRITLLEQLCCLPGWVSGWRVDRRPSPATVEFHNQAFRLLKNPPSTDDIFLLNSKLDHQKPGLIQHLERPALEKALQQTCFSNHYHSLVFPPEYPLWIEDILLQLSYHSESSPQMDDGNDPDLFMNSTHDCSSGNMRESRM